MTGINEVVNLRSAQQKDLYKGYQVPTYTLFVADTANNILLKVEKGVLKLFLIEAVTRTNVGSAFKVRELTGEEKQTYAEFHLRKMAAIMALGNIVTKPDHTTSASATFLRATNGNIKTMSGIKVMWIDWDTLTPLNRISGFEEADNNEYVVHYNEAGETGVFTMAELATVTKTLLGAAGYSSSSSRSLPIVKPPPTEPQTPEMP